MGSRVLSIFFIREIMHTAEMIPQAFNTTLNSQIIIQWTPEESTCDGNFFTVDLSGVQLIWGLLISRYFPWMSQLIQCLLISQNFPRICRLIRQLLVSRHFPEYVNLSDIPSYLLWFVVIYIVPDFEPHRGPD